MQEKVSKVLTNQCQTTCIVPNKNSSSSSSRLSFEDHDTIHIRTYPVNGRVVRSVDKMDQADQFDENGYDVELHLSKNLEPPTDDYCLLIVFDQKTEAWVTLPESQLQKFMEEIERREFQTNTRGRQHFATPTGAQPRTMNITVRAEFVKQSGEVMMKMELGTAETEGATAFFSKTQTQNFLGTVKRILACSDKPLSEIDEEWCLVE